MFWVGCRDATGDGGRVTRRGGGCGRSRRPCTPAASASRGVEELDRNERRAFLVCHRNLARLEENDRLVLTPFEKDIDMGRQLWRMLECSDLLVMVADARDSLFYRCPDLEEIDEHKRTMLLADKAGLLPLDIRLVPSPCDLVLIVRYLNCLRATPADGVNLLPYIKLLGVEQKYFHPQNTSCSSSFPILVPNSWVPRRHVIFSSPPQIFNLSSVARRSCAVGVRRRGQEPARRRAAPKPSTSTTRPPRPHSASSARRRSRAGTRCLVVDSSSAAVAQDE